MSTAAPVGTSVDANPGAPTDSGSIGSTLGWSATEEAAVLSVIESRSAFDGYDSRCVLRVIEDHFASLDEFGLASESDSPGITALASDVISDCGGWAGTASTSAVARAA